MMLHQFESLFRVEWNEIRITNGELVKIWEKLDVAYLEALSGHLPEGNEENDNLGPPDM